ncbi:MAG: sialidase family protein [Planctomycetota bacterium]
MNIDEEIKRSNPDYVIYKPKSLDGSTEDTGNEHLLVFDNPDGRLSALWTQSTHELKNDHRIVISHSSDKGKSWSEPFTISGFNNETGETRASWGIPLLSKSGRLYVLYNRYNGKKDLNYHICGVLAGKYSDDNGDTWSSEEQIAMPKTIWDSPEPDMPANWVIWQKPVRNNAGLYFTGMTRWVSDKAKKYDNFPLSVTEFLTFNNIDDNPEVKDIDITFHMQNENALNVPGHNIEEPSWVKLPDRRLLAVMRTSLNAPYFSISEDDGTTWTRLMPLRQSSTGMILIHQLSPSPIYEIEEGKYALFIHNNTETFRRPVFVCYGKYVEDEKQPIEFEEPKPWADNEGIPIGPGPRKDFALYTSMTFVDGKSVLWYPERKFFLLGREI